MAEQNQQIVLRKPDDLKVFIAKNHMAQIKNFFGDDKQAMKFMSSMMASVQKTPELLKCEPMSVINSFMTMAQLALMPSDVSGEAYILPYAGEAKFQLGYQGLVTLFYRAGGTGIRSEIVRANDKFSNINGVIHHEIDIFKSNEERGDAVGAYVIASFGGGEISKAMNKADIMAMGQKFSKSFSTKYSPWKQENDPELWMWKKTVLKQAMKLMPKNETINQAIDYDNQDSRISEVKGLVEENNLKMGNFLKKNDKDKTDEESFQEAEDEEIRLDRSDSQEHKG